MPSLSFEAFSIRRVLLIFLFMIALMSSSLNFVQHGLQSMQKRGNTVILLISVWHLSHFTGLSIKCVIFPNILGDNNSIFDCWFMFSCSLMKTHSNCIVDLDLSFSIFSIQFTSRNELRDLFETLHKLVASFGLHCIKN